MIVVVVVVVFMIMAVMITKVLGRGRALTDF